MIPLDEIVVTTTGSSVKIHLLELAVDANSTANSKTLTAEYGDISEEEKETRFSEEHLYSVDNGDIYYMEVAQEVFNEFQEYYETLLTTLFHIKAV